MRFGYDGSGFSGWARQPTGRTVEGVVREGLLARHVAPDLATARLEVASRTDSGVSARANALAVTSDLPAASLLRRLNTIAPELFFTGATSVPSRFRVRGALQRTYRYFESDPPVEVERYDRALSLLRGRIDVRSFGRSLTATAPTWRDLLSVTRGSHDGGSMIEVRAPSFVWGEVRKIVGALREVDAGRLSLTELQAAVGGIRRLTLPMAEPDGLVLWEVRYGIPWETLWSGPNRRQTAYLETLRRKVHQRRSTLRALFAGDARTAR